MDATLASHEETIAELFRMDAAIAAGGGLVEDPWPAWKALQAKGAVHKGSMAECMGLPPERNGGGLYNPDRTYYSVFSFAAVSEVFTRKDDFWSDSYVDMGVPKEFGETILNMDGQRHRRYRNVIQSFFQPGAAASWWRENVIDPIVSEIVEGLGAKRSVDVNSKFFMLLPQHTMTSGFGLSFEEGLDLRRLMLGAQHAHTPEEQLAHKQAAGRLLERAIVERRKAPRDDLISHLAQGDLEDDDGTIRKLTVEEITSFCRLIVFAGGETTWRMMAIAFHSLLNHPEQLKQVVADRSLLPAAVLESVRWHPEPMFPRKVKRDTVLAGVELPAGAHLHLCLGAANRDPARWSHPDVFDIHRPFQRSVAFAAGAHSCLGQHVARQEIEAALGALFEHFPNIRWDPDHPPAEVTGSLVQRGPGPLHVLLD